jgi:hypothetical protein
MRAGLEYWSFQGRASLADQSQSPAWPIS